MILRSIGQVLEKKKAYTLEMSNLKCHLHHLSCGKVAIICISVMTKNLQHSIKCRDYLLINICDRGSIIPDDNIFKKVNSFNNTF